MRKTGELGGLVGTTFIVRDILQIIEALNEDGMFRYLGYSYGSVVGAVFAKMFPERVDKVILDSIPNLYEWFSGW